MNACFWREIIHTVTLTYARFCSQWRFLADLYYPFVHVARLLLIVSISQSMSQSIIKPTNLFHGLRLAAVFERWNGFFNSRGTEMIQSKPYWFLSRWYIVILSLSFSSNFLSFCSRKSLFIDLNIKVLLKPRTADVREYSLVVFCVVV